jgi:hypothetical protein
MIQSRKNNKERMGIAIYAEIHAWFQNCKSRYPDLQQISNRTTAKQSLTEDILAIFETL